MVLGLVTGQVKNFDTTVCEDRVDDNKVGVGETLCVAVLGDFILLADPRDSEADVRLQ